MNDKKLCEDRQRRQRLTGMAMGPKDSKDRDGWQRPSKMAKAVKGGKGYSSIESIYLIYKRGNSLRKQCMLSFSFIQVSPKIWYLYRAHHWASSIIWGWKNRSVLYFFQKVLPKLSNLKSHSTKRVIFSCQTLKNAITFPHFCVKTFKS